ncbi:hypothetical protein V6N11_024628 [Hibiscus sabdariffa]|uniref:Uncharacterized protein n=1 Tax=Hibiscus sabdariffa TaxID=183260 RepID=A0ABR2QMP5_9ROSI
MDLAVSLWSSRVASTEYQIAVVLISDQPRHGPETMVISLYLISNYFMNAVQVSFETLTISLNMKASAALISATLDSSIYILASTPECEHFIVSDPLLFKV